MSYNYRLTSGDDSESDEYEYVDYLVDGVIYRQYARKERVRSPYAAYYYSLGFRSVYEDESDVTEIPRRRRQSSSTTQRPSSTRYTAQPRKANPTPKATEADARKHRIPAGYSLKNWDPSEEPIMLLGSVFDANSLGKWIYDWTVYHYGPATPIADMAGELWLLLIQLAGKIKRSEECIERIRKKENKEMIDDFIESGERLTDKLKKLLRSCEAPMLKTMKKAKKVKAKDGIPETVLEDVATDGSGLLDGSEKATQSETTTETPSSADVLTAEASGSAPTSTITENEVTMTPTPQPRKKQQTPTTGTRLRNEAATAFIDSIFGRERQLEATEKFMGAVRLWNLRFDANCEDILRMPDQ